MSIVQNIQEPLCSIEGARSERVAGFPPAPRQPWWLKLGTAGLFMTVTVAFAFYVVFSRKLSLDEGYLMITVRGFLEGSPLYDKLFTQYGPFYYLYEWFVHTVLQVPLTHDATRWMCMFHWVAASTLLAFASARLSRSTFVGLFVFAQSVVHLGALANEPGHPQEIVVLLLALALACAAKARPTRAVELIAIVIAAMAFTKINVGAFLGFALLLTLRCLAADGLARWSNPFVALLCAALPFVLTRNHLSLHECFVFTVIPAVTVTLTFVTAWRCAAKIEIPAVQYFRLGLFFLVPALCFSAVALLSGSSVHGLLDGLILTPLSMPGSVFLGLPLRDIVLVNAGASAACAALVAWKRSNPYIRMIVSVLKVCYGVVGAFMLIGGPVAQFAYLLPWVWVVLVPSTRAEETEGTATFPRVFLCLAAAWTSLQAYPIAGTQISDGTCLLVITYALCLADTWRALRLTERFANRVAAWRPGTARLATMLPLALLLYLFANVWCELPVLRRAYTALTPLDLPGSHLIRVTPECRDFFHQLADYLEAESDTFVTLPSVNSLYFWTSKRPPTQLNGSGWYQFNRQQQTQILAALWRGPRPRLVVPVDFKEHLPTYWYKPEQIAPLLDCLAHDCQEVHRIGPMVVYAPKPLAQVSKTP